uniref:Peroxisomal biogenesis factor 26 n=1 Tax=Sinocyclocheilus rhinocerous TaxID=307959 RepID=A0A673GZS3_9TELE
MTSSSSVFLAGGRGSGSVRLSSPPACPLTAPVDAAVEYLMVKKDFQAVLDTCEKGLESLGSFAEQEDSCFKYAELKASLTIVGIQAMAELNQWRGVHGFCSTFECGILLYVKVGERAVMKEAVCDWLQCSGNMSQSGFSTVAELYFLHILVPMGLTAEALEMLETDVCRVAFTEEQRQAAREFDKLTQRLTSIMRLIRSISVRKVFLALILLYLLLIRIDPALPSAFPWLLRLHGLLQQTWNTMFGPYYRANTRS